MTSRAGRAGGARAQGAAASPSARQAIPAEEATATAGQCEGRGQAFPGAPAASTATPVAGAKPGEDCGVCGNCLDKRKFGGPGLKRKACTAKRAAAAKVAATGEPVSDSASVHSPHGASTSTGAAGFDSIAGPSSLGLSSLSPCMEGLESPSPAPGLRVSDMLATTPFDRAPGGPELVKTPIPAGFGVNSPALSSGKHGPSPAEAAAIVAPRAAGSSANGSSTSSGADVSGYKPVSVVVQGVGSEEVEGRAPLNELPVNHPMSKSHTPAMGVPSTPMKTPEIEALVNAAASPLSEFANLLDSAQHLPSLSNPQSGAAPQMSPLLQLADFMDQTPRMPIERLGLSSAERPAHPDELKHALLNSSLGTSPIGNTPEQLRNDLRAALQQSGFDSLGKPSANQHSMPPPAPRMSPAPGAQDKKARKRNLEESLGSGGVSMMAGMFDSIDGSGLDLGDPNERFSIGDLLEQPALGLPPPNGRRKSSGGGKRSKRQEKEKGKPAKCRCDKSGCLKRYCVCFAAGNVCSADCGCKGCFNDEDTEERKQQRAEAIKLMEKKKSNAFKPRIGMVGMVGEEGEEADQVHLVGCNCKKSGCSKRYCECYQAGVKCTDKCKCCDCKNPHGAFEGCRRTDPAEAELLTPSASKLLGLEGLLNSGGSTRSSAARETSRSPTRVSPKSPRAPTSPADTLIAAAEAAEKAEEMDIDYLRVDSYDRLSERGAVEPSPLSDALGSSREANLIFARPRGRSPAAGTPGGDTFAGASSPATAADTPIASVDTPVSDTPSLPDATTWAVGASMPCNGGIITVTPAGKPQPRLQAPSSEAMSSVGPTTSFAEIPRPVQVTSITGPNPPHLYHRVVGTSPPRPPLPFTHPPSPPARACAVHRRRAADGDVIDCVPSAATFPVAFAGLPAKQGKVRIQGDAHGRRP